MVSFFFYGYNLSCFIAPWLLWLAFYGFFPPVLWSLGSGLQIFHQKKEKPCLLLLAFLPLVALGSLLVSVALCLVGCGRPLGLLSLRSGSVSALRV